MKQKAGGLTPTNDNSGGTSILRQQLQGIPQAVLKQAAAAGQAGTVQARVIPVSSAGGGRGPQIQVSIALYNTLKKYKLRSSVYPIDNTH